MEICKIFQYNRGMSREPRVRIDRLKEDIDTLISETGVKPAVLAKEFGVSYDTLYKTLRGGIAQPSAELVAKIAIRAKRPVEYYLNMTDSRVVLYEELTEKQHAIMRLLRELPDFRQADILRIAETFASGEEESTREVFAYIKNLLVDIADKQGRTAGIDELLEALNQKATQRNGLPGPIEDIGKQGGRAD